MRPFSLLIKPSGSDCNLNCEYCFYKDREPQIGCGRQRMSEELLEKLISNYLGSDMPMYSFSWQGGEPTLMGLDFYRKAVELQNKYAGKTISNTFQTNGVLLDESWCEFFGENKWLVGISLDGPRQMHDRYRKDFNNEGSFEAVVESVELCKKQNVDFNILALVNNLTAKHPDEVFDFFIELGVNWLQFIPCVEFNQDGSPKDFTVKPEDYGKFLCRIFDRWLDRRFEISIRDFETVASYVVTGNHSVCTFCSKCSDYIVVEHDGQTFCCDFHVTPQWRLGNIKDSSCADMLLSEKKKEFSRAKNILPLNCQICRHLEICRGGCLKDRLDGKNYLCQAYKMFFPHVLPKIRQFAAQAVQRK